jgi:hypothetical protein
MPTASLDNNDSNNPRTERRLTFFGEKLEDFGAQSVDSISDTKSI